MVIAALALHQGHSCQVPGVPGDPVLIVRSGVSGMPGITVSGIPLTPGITVSGVPGWPGITVSGVGGVPGS